MSGHESIPTEPPDDDESDAGDPFEAGRSFLASLSTRARLRFAGLGTAEAGRGVRDLPVERRELHGPQARFLFHWRGRRCDFSNASDRYSLVRALWDSGSGNPHAECDLDEVLDAVYGEDREGTKKSMKSRMNRLKNLMYHVKRALLQAGLAVTVRHRGGKVWLEELP